MKRYNVSVPRKYDKNGETKTAWNTVGKLIHFEATGDKPEGYVLELYMHPDTKFGVFEDVPRDQRKAQPAPADEPSIDL
jgi:hypothetical protein